MYAGEDISYSIWFKCKHCLETYASKRNSHIFTHDWNLFGTIHNVPIPLHTFSTVHNPNPSLKSPALCFLKLLSTSRWTWRCHKNLLNFGTLWSSFPSEKKMVLFWFEKGLSYILTLFSFHCRRAGEAAENPNDNHAEEKVSQTWNHK